MIVNMPVAKTLDPINFPLFGNRLIEASAGTGKTYTIAALYVRLILNHGSEDTKPQRELLPSDILVVTFTDAATKELRERIRHRLTTTARYFREQPVDNDDFMQQLRASYDCDSWSGCARRLEIASNWMDEAAIYTIHGWCNRMLQQHAFASGSLFKQEVNTHDAELLRTVVLDYWRTFYYSLQDDNFKTVTEIFQSPDDLQKIIGHLITSSDAIDTCNTIHNSLDELCADYYQRKQSQLSALKKPWIQWADEMEALIDDAVNKKMLPARNYNSANRGNWFKKIRLWSASSEQTELDIGKGFDNLSPQGLQVLTTTGNNPPEHVGFMALSQIPEQIAALPKLKIELIKHAILWIRHRYTGEKQRLAQLTFDDMLTRLDNALHSEQGDRLVNIINEQFPIALIDEFQDTDPIQYRIIERLYPATCNNGLACLMIGDPKQAIYSFRGADIYTYLKAHEATEDRHYTLNTNFRSTQALVEAVNQIFAQADKHAEGAFLFKNDDVNPIPFIPVKAKGRDELWIEKGDVSAAPLTLWHWPAEGLISAPVYRNKMAEATASEIVELLITAQQGQTGFKSIKDDSFKALQAGDIAILVRTGKEAHLIRNALSRRQLRSVYLSENDNVYKTDEARDILFWLRAFAEPRNERRVRAALSTQSLGWTYQALYQLTVDETLWEQQLERFLDYQLRWQEDGVLPALRQFINDYQIHLQLQQSATHDSERSLTNLLHLAELLQQASMQLEGEQALIRFLAEAIADENGQTPDEHTIRLESDANLIKIVTIHKSKGLEYPLVFLPFICSFREVSARFDNYYRYHDDNQTLRIELNKSDDIRKFSDKERLQEDLRLLYVAMTRARYACWLGISPLKVGNDNDCQLEKSAIGHLLNWRDKLEANHLLNQLNKLKGHCAAIAIKHIPTSDESLLSPSTFEENLTSPRTAHNKIADSWWIASYSALPTFEKNSSTNPKAQIQEIETAQDDKQSDEADVDKIVINFNTDPVHTLPRGAGPGVLIHTLLEQCGQYGFQTVATSPLLGQQLIKSIFNQPLWQDKHEILDNALAQWLRQPLLAGTTTSLADLDNGQYQTELEFLIGANTVSVAQLDALISEQTFNALPRPKLAANQINGLLKGFIDLVFVVDQQYYVADYKFNHLGNQASVYTTELLTTTMLNKRYDLQSILYLLALHRLLKVRLGEAYHYDTHVGGCLYLFLRGHQGPAQGRIFYKPPHQLIEELDAMFAGTVTQGDQ